MFVKEKVFQQVEKPLEEQKRKALIMVYCFVIEKRDGRIKARAVTDGRSQQRYTEEETYSPMVKLESIMLNAFVDAYEGRHVVTVDIKGAFLKAKVPEDMELIVKIDGELMHLMCKKDCELKHNCQKTLYLQCKKALYGHIEAARLFCIDLDHTLQEKLKFTQNQYDPCVYSKVTENEKFTMRIKVDGLKISSKSLDKLNPVVKQLKEVYGEITVHSGLDHDYLGMILSYCLEKRRISLNMKKYTVACIEEFKKENLIKNLKCFATPATSNLFQIRKECERELLEKERKSSFHLAVAK